MRTEIALVIAQPPGIAPDLFDGAVMKEIERGERGNRNLKPRFQHHRYRAFRQVGPNRPVPGDSIFLLIGTEPARRWWSERGRLFNASFQQFVEAGPSISEKPSDAGVASRQR